MTQTAIPIKAPKESVSDESYRVVEIVIPSGSAVTPGDMLAILETSKAVFDLTSPAEGHFHALFQEGDEVTFDQNFGFITNSSEIPEGLKPLSTKTTSPSSLELPHGTRFSKSALALIESSQIDVQQFAHLALVKKEDVVRYLTNQSSTTLSLPTHLDKSRAIVLVGGGGILNEVVEILEHNVEYSIAGIVSDRLKQGDKHPILGTSQTLPQLRQAGISYAVFAVGMFRNHKGRAAECDRLRDLGYQLPNIIHPLATVSHKSRLGWHNLILGNTYVGSNVELGNDCILDIGSTIAHDCRLGDNVHLAPGVTLAGHVEIGRDTLIGVGCNIFAEVKIGEGVTVSNGVSIFEDIPDRAFVDKHGRYRHIDSQRVDSQRASQ